MKFTDDVKNHFKRCIDIVSNFEADRFSIEAFNKANDSKIESPIEQILYLAIKTVCRINWCEKTLENTPHGSISTGVHVYPQYEIGKYRVDFFVEFSRIDYINSDKSNVVLKKTLVVECDSQQFHDRTEQERRYEKKRDRFLQKQGHKIFHFTGKEIKDEPFRIAAEIIAFVTDESVEDILQSEHLE